jgi:hypothetical protein
MTDSLEGSDRLEGDVTAKTRNTSGETHKATIPVKVLLINRLIEGDQNSLFASDNHSNPKLKRKQ